MNNLDQLIKLILNNIDTEKITGRIIPTFLESWMQDQECEISTLIRTHGLEEAATKYNATYIAKNPDWPIEDIEIQVLSKDLKNQIHNYAKLALLHHAEAKLRLEKEDYNSAFINMTASTRCCGYVDGLITAETCQKHLKEESENRAKGGKAKSDKNLPVKAKLFKLLSAEKPSLGWSSKQEVAQKIGPALQEFIERAPEASGAQVGSTNVHELILQWLNNEPLIKYEYGQNSKAK